jgi:phosphatidylglycerol:prolipoprotein diacylglycerol transferase
MLSFELLGRTITIHWYGVILSIAVIVGVYVYEKEFTRRGGDIVYMYRGLVWVIPAGMIGARIWYVFNSILGGSRYYLDDFRRILDFSQGGLHIFGLIFFGWVVGILFTRFNPYDIWLLQDPLGPTFLLAQAVGRVANFVNQELYGPPTEMPWGIPISAEHRQGSWADLNLFPEDSTRFHPTFAYEMLWNLLAAALILWSSRRFPDKFKPGAAFFLWMILAGVGRFFIESFRPDQPRLGDTDISFSRIFSALFAFAGTVFWFARQGKFHLPFIPTTEDYIYRKKKKK